MALLAGLTRTRLARGWASATCATSSSWSCRKGAPARNTRCGVLWSKLRRLDRSVSSPAGAVGHVFLQGQGTVRPLCALFLQTSQPLFYSMSFRDFQNKSTNLCSACHPSSVPVLAVIAHWRALTIVQIRVLLLIGSSVSPGTARRPLPPWPYWSAAAPSSPPRWRALLRAWPPLLTWQRCGGPPWRTLRR